MGRCASGYIAVGPIHRRKRDPHSKRPVLMGDAMPTIDVNTTSTNFGNLPADASQFSNWISQYIPSSTTIYQSEYNDITYMMNLGDGFDAYLYANGYSSLNFVNANELQLISGPYTVDYYGTFSSTFSQVTRVFMHDSANATSASEAGTFNYAGYPVLSALEAGSTMTGATALEPDPVTPGNNISAAVLLNTTWNGSDWSGYTTGASEAISESTTGQMVQVNYFSTDTAISYAPNTPTTTGFLNFSVPQIDGAGVVVSNFSSGTTTDSELITGFSYSASQVSDAAGFAAAMAGNDVVSITGAGSFNVIPALVADAASISAVTLYDSAANVQTNLSYLEQLAADGKLSSISLTDAATPTISLTPSQQTADAAVLSRIVTPFYLNVLPCFAAGTRIVTHRGEVMVQHLNVGDRVWLANGSSAAVVWLGHRRVDCRRHPRRQDVLPVRIAAHAFGLGRPARDLLLSPDHAVFSDGVLIPIRYLLNDATVRQEDAAAVIYWHVELAEHGVLLAEGLPAESYLDTGNRGAFANAGAMVMAHPDFARSVWAERGCAPLVTEGPVSDLVYRRLVAQAFALGWRQESLGGNIVRWLRPDVPSRNSQQQA